jgi:hypothetical protein
MFCSSEPSNNVSAIVSSRTALRKINKCSFFSFFLSFYLSFKFLTNITMFFKSCLLTPDPDPQHWFFISLNGSEQNSECVSLLRNFMEHNSEHFYLPRNGLERNYDSNCFFLLHNGSERNSELFLSSTEWFRTEFRVFLSSTEWLGTKFRAFSVLQNRRNSDGMSQNFRLFRVPRNFFFLGKWQP